MSSKPPEGKNEEEPGLPDCLDDIEAVIKETQSLLDLGYYTCRSCGSRRYNHFGHKKMNDALGVALSRIKSAQESYERE